MIDIAKHIRIFEPVANDEFVEKRVKAVNAIEAEFKKRKSIDDKLILADDFGNLLLDFTSDPHGIASLIKAAIKEQSTSFVAEGAELEIITCGLLGLAQWIETSGNANLLGVTDTIAISLWSCLSFQNPLDADPKLELLRKELIQISQNRISQSSMHARKRNEIKAVADIATPEDNTFPTFVISLNNSYKKAINDLRKNAVLDREEIDCLWWALSEWSDISNCSLTKLNPIQRAIVSGVEFASLLRRVPGNSHKNLLLRYLDNDATLDATELLSGLSEIATPIKEYLSHFPIISKAPLIFPLFNTVISGRTDINGSNTKRPINEWALRALIESSIINLNTILEDAK